MTGNFVSALGDFALLGFCEDPNSGWLDRMTRWGLAPRLIEFGPTGRLFFFSTYGDRAETGTTLGLKLGFARTPGFSALSTADLLGRKLIEPHTVRPDRIRGNALLACLSKSRPEFSIYQTLFATPQLYYTATGPDILCSSSLRCLAHLLEKAELNESVMPHHFMFRLAPGALTYYRAVHRLFPGQHLHWRDGRWQVVLINTLRLDDSEARYDHLGEAGAERIYDRIREVVDVCLDEVGKAGCAAANLLSGGVDSSVVQMVLNERRTEAAKPTSYSYAVRVPGFEFEVDYARKAARLLDTEHHIAEIQPAAFPETIRRAIEAVAQPVSGEADVCKIAMVEYLAGMPDSARFYLSGQAADALFGTGLARKVAVANRLRNVPGSICGLRTLAGLLKPAAPRLADGFREIATALAARDKPDDVAYWPNTVYTYASALLARRVFGDQVLGEVLADRRRLEEQYLGSNDLNEKLHTIDMLTEAYEPAVLGGQMFLSRGKEQIHPFLDEDIIRIAFAFSPKVRFIKPGFGILNRHNTKHLLKTILDRRSYREIVAKRKGASVFDTDLFRMMREGALREMVLSIDRPDFLSRLEFDELLRRPDYFTWNLLTFDTFNKQVLMPLRQSANVPRARNETVRLS